MKKFNGKTTLKVVYDIYLEEIKPKSNNYYNELIAKKGYDCFGIVNATHKHAVKLLLEHTSLPYTKELGKVLKSLLFENCQPEKLSSLMSMTIDDACYNMYSNNYILD